MKKAIIPGVIFAAILSACGGGGGDPIYKDGDHLSAAFVRNNATFIDQTVAVK